MQIDEQTDGKRQPEIFDIILNLDVAIRLTCIETRANNIIRTDILHRFHSHHGRLSTRINGLICK